jgi:hypothetical protein
LLAMRSSVSATLERTSLVPAPLDAGAIGLGASNTDAARRDLGIRASDFWPADIEHLAFLVLGTHPVDLRHIQREQRSRGGGGGRLTSDLVDPPVRPSDVRCRHDDHGLGYCIRLTDFRDTLGVVTSEPHNSVISVVARLGLIGLISWLWMQIELFRAGLRAYLECRRIGLRQSAELALLLIAFTVLTLSTCLGEDTIEKPYNAIPDYAFRGIVIRIAYRLRAQAPRRYLDGAPAIENTPIQGSAP